MRSDAEERAILVKCLREEASEQHKDAVRMALLKLAEQIEKMESNQGLEDVKGFEK